MNPGATTAARAVTAPVALHGALAPARAREDPRPSAPTLPDAAATALLDFGEFIKGMADDVKPPPLTARDLVHWAAFVKHLEGKVDVVEALGHGRRGAGRSGRGEPCVERTL